MKKITNRRNQKFTWGATERCSAASRAITCISFDMDGLISLAGKRNFPLLPALPRRRKAVMQSDTRKRMSTMTAPITIPITTHRCRPKIDVLLESFMFPSNVCKNDISAVVQIHKIYRFSTYLCTRVKVKISHAWGKLKWLWDRN